MKKYPKIYHHNKGNFGSYCYAFNKLDGSNIRGEWDQKLSKKSTSTLGFRKFGTRNQIISNINHPFSESIDLFMDKYSENMDKIFREDTYFRGIRKITIYLEYFGKNSFAGQHEDNDTKNLILLDVERFQKGFVEPKNFIDKFEHLDIPDIIYQGEYNEEFINKVRDGSYNVTEGVVCKGTENKKVWMTKIKTLEWLYKVKDKHGIEYVREDFNNDEELMGKFKETI